MYNNFEKGEITAQTTQNVQSEGVKFYFDCATMMEERGVVYDEMTPENLRDWFKATKFKFPVRVMGQDDVRAWIDREDGEYILTVYKCHDIDDDNRWTLRIGKRFTESRWFGVTRFIEAYITGVLQEQYGWSENKNLKLA